MNRTTLIQAAFCLACCAFLAGCEKNVGAQEKTPGPVSSTLQPDFDPNNFKVDHPEKFALTTTSVYAAASELNVTGAVNPDVSRQVPVPSLATGRVVEIHAQLGDHVTKGQILFKVRSQDVAGAFSNYLQAVKNEELTRIQLNRAKTLLEDGAVAKSAVEIAQNAEDDNEVLLNAAREQLNLLGLDPKHSSAVVSVVAPVTGVITDQQITNQSGVQALSTPNPFTISDLSRVWIICDVYENDLAQVRLGQFADVRLNGYPSRLLKGRISNIGPILDPNIRTAKVRLELANPGFLHLGMFATATFHGLRKDTYATLPASAILHLHDRDWVYAANGSGYFQRREVVAGNMLPGDIQIVNSGINPGVHVVLNALDLQNTVSQ